MMINLFTRIVSIAFGTRKYYFFFTVTYCDTVKVIFDLKDFMLISEKEFQEIGHCGGQYTVAVKDCSLMGVSYQLGMRHSRPNGSRSFLLFIFFLSRHSCWYDSAWRHWAIVEPFASSR